MIAARSSVIGGTWANAAGRSRGRRWAGMSTSTPCREEASDAVTVNDRGQGGNLGQTLAVSEALVGEIYLVTVVAAIAGRLIPRRADPISRAQCNQPGNDPAATSRLQADRDCASVNADADGRADRGGAEHPGREQDADRRSAPCRVGISSLSRGPLPLPSLVTSGVTGPHRPGRVQVLDHLVVVPGRRLVGIGADIDEYRFRLCRLLAPPARPVPSGRAPPGWLPGRRAASSTSDDVPVPAQPNYGAMTPPQRFWTRSREHAGAGAHGG